MYDMAYRSRGEGVADGGRGRHQVAAGGGGGGVVAGLNQPLQLQGSSTKKHLLLQIMQKSSCGSFFPLKTETFSRSVNENTTKPCMSKMR